MKFQDIELGSYLVSNNKSFLYYVIEKDYKSKSIKIEVLDAQRPLLKFSEGFRFRELKDFSIYEKYVKPIKKVEKMDREILEGKIIEILIDSYGIDVEDSHQAASDIVHIIPKSPLEQVEEFMITAQQPTENKVDEITDERRKFRISLIQEELQEFIDAKDSTERLDATGDMIYVLIGLIIEEGFKDVIDDVVTEIHRSNMSKFDQTIDDANLTYEKYQREGLDTYTKKVGKNIVTYRTSDNKVLKSHNYSPPNLKQFLK